MLVGHSMGGLVATSFELYLAEAKGINVLHVFTLGTPFHGSSIASLLPGKNLAQMATDANYLHLIRERLAQRKEKYSQIVGERDIYINSVDSDTLPVSLSVNTGHLGLLVAAQVKQFICKRLLQLHHKQCKLPLPSQFEPKKIIRRHSI